MDTNEDIEIRNGKLRILQNNYIISKEINYGKYSVKYETENGYSNIIFNSEPEFIQVYNEVINKNIKGAFFHEIITDGIVKLFFDIDIKRVVDNEIYFQYSNSELESQIINTLFKRIKSYNNNIEDEYLNNYIIATHHRDNKKSFRIIFPNLTFNNIREHKEFVLNIGKGYFNIIDVGIYKLGQCRLINSSKRGIKGRLEDKNFISFSKDYLICNSSNTKQTIKILFLQPIKLNIKKCDDISYEYLDELMNVKFYDIYKHYRLGFNKSKLSYRLENRGNGKCFINQNEIHKKDNTEIYINKTYNKICIKLFCFRCKDKYKNGDKKQYIADIDIIKLKNAKKHKETFYDCIKLKYKKKEENKLVFFDWNINYNSKKYLELDDVKDYLHSLLYLALYCAGGKTTIMEKIVKYLINVEMKEEHDNKNLYVVFLSCRRTLTAGIFTDLNKALENENINFQSYLMPCGKKSIKNFTSNFRVISPESLYKLCGDLVGKENEHKKVYVINEEMPHLINQFQSIKTHGEQLHNNRKTFEELNKKSFGICCLSGTPDKITNDYIRTLTNLKPIVIDFTNKKPIKSLKLYKDTNKSNMMNELYKNIENKEYPILIGWYDGVNTTNKMKISKLDKFEKLIKLKYKDANITIICSKTDEKLKLEYGNNPTVFLEKYKTDIFIFSSTSGIGNNILTNFKSGFFFFNLVCCSDPSNTTQMIWRGRKCEKNYCIISYFGKKYKTETEQREKLEDNYKNFITGDKKIKEVGHKIDFIKLKKLKQKSIKTVIEDRGKYLNQNYIKYFIKYSYNNRIHLEFEGDDEIDDKYFNLKENKNLSKELTEEQETKYTNDFIEAKKLNVEEYEILTNKITKDENDYLMMTKYHLYKFGFIGEVNKGILKCNNKINRRILSNIRTIINFKVDEDLIYTDDKDEKIKMIENLMKPYQNLNEIVRMKIYNILIKGCNLEINKELGTDKELADDKIIRGLKYKIKEIEELIKCEDFEDRDIIMIMSDYKIKTYITMLFLYLFKLPILKENVYDRLQFNNLCETITKIINRERRINIKLWNAYFYLIGFNEGQRNKLLMSDIQEETDFLKNRKRETYEISKRMYIQNHGEEEGMLLLNEHYEKEKQAEIEGMKEVKKDSNKAMIEFIRLIIGNYGMELCVIKDKNDTLNHKYIFSFKKLLKDNLSIFKTNNKIPLLNYYYDEIDMLGDDTRNRVNQLNDLLNIDVKQTYKTVLNTRKKESKKLERERLKQMKKNAKTKTKKKKKEILDLL
jgi:hypothetical protein